MLRTILAIRGVQSPFQQDWLDLNPTVCSNSTGPSGVKSDILSYWVWVILAQTYSRYLGNSELWPAIWLFIPRVCYQQTELAHPQRVLMLAVLKNLLRLFNYLSRFCSSLNFLFSLRGGRKRIQGNSVCTGISQVFWIPSKPTTAPKCCGLQLHYGMGQKVTLTLICLKASLHLHLSRAA